MARILIFAQKVNQLSSGLLSHLSGHHIEMIASGEPEQLCLQNLKYYGVSCLHLLQQEHVGDMRPQDYIKTLHQFLCEHHFDYVFTDTSSLSTEIFPPLSAIFHSALVTGAIDFLCSDEALIATKMLYGGECLVDVEMMGPKPWFITVEVNALESGANNEGVTRLNDMLEVITYNACHDDESFGASYIKESHSKYLPLDEADIIVSGGRGIRDDADMKLLEDLADVIGAAVGISLGALDSDVGTKDILIGLTGSSVKPSLYIACGISGASQHMAGLRGAKRILAINSDPNAPLMRTADYAVIGNLYEVLPVLTAKLSD